MNKFKRFCAVTLLVCLLALPVFAGETESPGVVNPPPPPSLPAAQNSSNNGETESFGLTTAIKILTFLTTI